MRRFYRSADRTGSPLGRAGWSLPPVEIEPPDLTPHRVGNTGIDYVTSFAADAPGPHVVLMGLTHGNEICGAIALDQLLRQALRPARGRLTVAFANIPAYESFSRLDPAASRYIDEDLNRVWDPAVLASTRTSRELRRARTLRPIIDSADFLLDIHSTTNFNPPMMLTGLAEKNLVFARRLGAPGVLVRDEGHAGGKRLRDYPRFADPRSPAVALLIESGQHWARDTAATAQDIVRRFLAAAEILDEAAAARWGTAPRVAQRTITVTERITIASDEFAFVEPYQGLEVIARAGTVIARDGGRALRTPYNNCVLIMPARRFARGQTAVRLGRFDD